MQEGKRLELLIVVQESIKMVILLIINALSFNAVIALD